MVEEMKSEMAEVTPLNRGDIVKGKVTKVEDHQVMVDVNYKFDGVIPISELSSLHVDKASDVLSEGDEVEVKVIRINDEEDKLVLSKKQWMRIVPGKSCNKNLKAARPWKRKSPMWSKAVWWWTSEFADLSPRPWWNATTSRIFPITRDASSPSK